ncbi:hypothetical protein [Microbacterium trichothecenolyticum]|uniref:DUF916 domain-containing protein n=1 Tax=Microbacterium trichothecenolyticum TaxID=69370 RepID=A0ABU0TUI7_MICTR|nr:hypothetical protein [Microbacterium trichothecenolyticum]MDQ1123150.1 hypothetical protein [Microbacterium trichothecenolyticum]
MRPAARVAGRTGIPPASKDFAVYPRTLSALAAAALTVILCAGAAAPAVAAPSATVPPLVVGAASTSPSSPQWSVAPANADGPDGRISLRHTVDPGGNIADAIAVTNLGAESTSYLVAPGDGVLGDDGAFDIASGEPRDAGAWVSISGLDAGVLTLGPGETRVLPVRIDVPADAVPGDHPAGIVVGVSRGDGGVTVTNRIGVRLHLQVAGDLVAALEVDETNASFRPSWIPFAPGVVRVETRVSNTGNVRLGATSAVAGAGIDAASSGVEPVELLPGDTTTVVVESSAWPILALSGTVEVRPAVLGDDAIIAPTAAEARFAATAVSWSGLALLVLAAGAIVAGVVLRRRGRPRVESDPQGAPDTDSDEQAVTAESGPRVEVSAR